MRDHIVMQRSGDIHVTILGSLIIVSSIKSILNHQSLRIRLENILSSACKYNITSIMTKKNVEGLPVCDALKQRHQAKETSIVHSGIPASASLYHDRPSSWICAQILSVLQPVAIFLSTLSPAFTWSPHNS